MRWILRNGKRIGEPTDRFQQTCHQLLEFFRTERQKAPKPLPGSLEGLTTERSLECGLDLQAVSHDPKTVNLQIFFVRPRFEEWKKRLGPVDLFYANPFGIEVIYRKGAWAFFVEEERLPIPTSEGRVEVARFQINQEGARRVPLVPFALDDRSSSAQLVLAEPSRELATRECLPRGEQQVSRLLEALDG